MYQFGEKQTEWNAKTGQEMPVWQTPKYLEAKMKAVQIIESRKFDITEGDFWILMNATKNGKMAYTGLILSHNGCLKINDKLESKFKPEFLILDKEGYNESLVYSYCCPEQGLYEVGEVSAKNCKNEYPYAMAFKRCFDRVVLKLSKLAYAGIYSDSESDEFIQRLEAPEGQETAGGVITPPKQEKPVTGQNKANTNPSSGFACSECGAEITQKVSEYSSGRFGRPLCMACQRKTK